MRRGADDILEVNSGRTNGDREKTDDVWTMEDEELTARQKSRSCRSTETASSREVVVCRSKFGGRSWLRTTLHQRTTPPSLNCTRISLTPSLQARKGRCCPRRSTSRKEGRCCTTTRRGNQGATLPSRHRCRYREVGLSWCPLEQD